MSEVQSVAHNVFYELPNLVIKDADDVEYVFTFEDSYVTSWEAAREKYVSRKDSAMLLEVSYDDVVSTDGTATKYLPHIFLVSEVNPQHHFPPGFSTGTEPGDSVYTALAYAVTAEMTVMLRQWYYRKAEPRPSTARLLTIDEGLVLARTISTKFEPHKRFV